MTAARAGIRAAAGSAIAIATAAIAIAAIAAAGLGGCLRSALEVCGDGTVCPSDLRCAPPGSTLACVPPGCGNGRIDPGESCDDGNNLSGDGCPADCSPHCGDGILDPGEACDDGHRVGGNPDPGEPCSVDCRFVERCGDGIQDPTEECDDGNLVDHDGCSSDCKREQLAWQAIQPSAMPGILGRQTAGMAYDAGAGQTVLFGGNPSVFFSSSGALGDTERWDGARWLAITADGGPAARRAFAMTGIADGAMMYGGALADLTPLDELWTLRAGQWSRTMRPPAPAPWPSTRTDAALAFDPVHGQTVLFGGSSDGQGPFSLGDTWVFDGAAWAQASPQHAPEARQDYGLAFDAGRGNAVLFGGEDGDGEIFFDDTWLWNGSDWIAASPATRPSARGAPAMAYDAGRGVVVLFGGRAQINQDIDTTPLGDTWEWDGATWHPRTPLTSPPPRSAQAMAYDPARGRVVMFGGLSTIVLDDLWEWDGTDWEQRFYSAPQPRTHHAMALDTARHTAVVFGGIDTSGAHLLGETWLWDGTAWQQPSPAGAPPRRSDPAMVYDAARDRVVLFGGAGATGPLADTWEWDGAHWLARPTAAAPAARSGHAMVYDPVRHQVLVLGGAAADGLRFDHWAWDGAAWSDAAPAVHPVPRRDFAAAYDAARDRVVVFGGQGDAGLLHDVWEWDGQQWTERTPTAVNAPSARAGHAMAYDPLLQRVVVFGGQGEFASLDDAWAWDGTAWTELRTATAPPARQHHAMQYDPASGGLVVYAGDDAAATALDDLWLLSYEETTR